MGGACGILEPWCQQLLSSNLLPSRVGYLLCICFYLKGKGLGDFRIYGESLGGECAWSVWKEGKLRPQSTNKAKQENGKELLAVCQQGGSLCAVCDSGIQRTVQFSTLCWLSPPLGKVLNISVPHFFSFLLGVAVLPPLEAEMMWLLCVERSFLFWSSFTSAWRHFCCLLSVRLYSSDHCQLRLGLCCEIYDPYAGMFWAEHWEVEGQKMIFGQPGESPRPVWSLWRTAAEVDANTFLEETFGSEVLAVCLRNALVGGGYSLSLCSWICYMQRAWSLGCALNEGEHIVRWEQLFSDLGSW